MNKRYEKYKETYKSYRMNNKNKIKEIGKNYRQFNQDKIQEYKEDYKKRNQEELKLTWEKSRDRIYFGGIKNKVLERDNWTCQLCGMSNEKHIILFNRAITVHHKDGNGRNSNTKNNSMENLITLCLRCHTREDKSRSKTK